MQKIKNLKSKVPNWIFKIAFKSLFSFLKAVVSSDNYQEFLSKMKSDKWKRFLSFATDAILKIQKYQDFSNSVMNYGNNSVEEKRQSVFRIFLSNPRSKKDEEMFCLECLDGYLSKKGLTFSHEKLKQILSDE